MPFLCMVNNMFTMNNRTWFIEVAEADSDKLRRSDGSVTVGMCDGDRNTIYISELLHGEFLQKVLRHEITHAAMFSYGIELDIETEEIFCDLLATYAPEIIETADLVFKTIQKAVA